MAALSSSRGRRHDAYLWNNGGPPGFLSGY